MDRWLMRGAAALVAVAAALTIAAQWTGRGAASGQAARLAAVAEAAADARDWELAVSAAAGATALAPDEPRYARALLDAHVEQVLAMTGAPADAVRLQREIAAADAPETARRRVALAKLALFRGREAEAHDHLRAALAADPDEPEAHLYLGTARFGEGDLKGAAEALQTALRLDPKRALAHFTLGRVYTAEKRWDAAAEHLQQAASGLDNATAWLALGRVEAERGRWPEAVVALRRALAHDRESAAIRGFLGRALSATGDVDEAAGHLAAAWRQAGDLDAYAELGRLHLARGRVAEATAILREVARARPGDPEPAYALGLAAEAGGDVQAALAAMRDAITRAGDDQRHAALVQAARKRAELLAAASAAPPPRR